MTCRATATKLARDVTVMPNQFTPVVVATISHDPDSAIDAGQQGLERHRDQHVDERRNQQIVQQDHPAGDETRKGAQRVACEAVDRSRRRYRLGHGGVALRREVHAHARPIHRPARSGRSIRSTRSPACSGAQTARYRPTRIARDPSIAASASVRGARRSVLTAPGPDTSGAATPTPRRYAPRYSRPCRFSAGIQHVDIGARRILAEPSSLVRERDAARHIVGNHHLQLEATAAVAHQAAARPPGAVPRRPAGEARSSPSRSVCLVLTTLPKLVFSSHACAGDSRRRCPAAGRGSLQACGSRGWPSAAALRGGNLDAAARRRKPTVGELHGRPLRHPKRPALRQRCEVNRAARCAP